jgi:hypothetical protein
MPPQIAHAVQATNLADILERVLDKGIVIAGDIRVQVADIDLLTIKIRLLVASVDKAKEMGIDWWQTDPYLSSRAASSPLKGEHPGKSMFASGRPTGRADLTD